MTALAVVGMNLDSDRKLLVIALAAAAGLFGPNEYVRMAAKRRQKQIRRGLPNALDLLVVCVESGLGLDQAIMQVAKELEHAHPEISEEFAMVNLELKAGKRRAEALRNLADRTAVDELKKLVAVLIQADRFGTGSGPEPARALRLHAGAGAAGGRGKGRQARRQAGVSDFLLHFAVAVRGDGGSGDGADQPGAAPDDEEYLRKENRQWIPERYGYCARCWRWC